MAKRGPTPKAPDERHGHYKGHELRIVPATRHAIVQEPPPKPPSGLLAATRRVWGAFWESKVAKAVDILADGQRLERWIRDIDEYYRVRPVFRSSRLVKGSTGQPVMNPLGSYLAELERRIAAAETEFGLTPQARARLGLTIGQERLTVEELNRRLRSRSTPQDGDSGPTEQDEWEADWADP